MYNANASGSHSVKYGNTNDYVLDAEIILTDGSILWLSEIEELDYKTTSRKF